MHHCPLEQLADAWTLSCTGRPEAARLLAEEVRQVALADADQHALALANEQLAWYCLMQLRLEDGLRYATVAVSLWSELRDRAHEAVSGGTLAWLMCEVGNEEAVAEAQRAVALAEQTDDPAARAWARNALCVVLWMLQQHDLSARAGVEAAALARLTGDPVAIGRCLLNAALPEEGLAGLAADSGDTVAERAHCDRAIEMTREAATTCEACGDTWAACIALGNMVEWLIRIGRLAEARTALEEAGALSGEASDSRRVVMLHMNALLVSAEGRRQEAVPLLQETLDTTISMNELCVATQVARELSDVLETCGRFREALQMHRQFFALYTRRSAERSQLRARMLSERQEVRELQTRVAQFERLAGEDALTGLANRRHLDLLLAERLHRGESYGLAIIDVDHFKAVNDTLTHLVGDKVLRAVSAILASVARKDDCLGRFGGEEFLLIASAASARDGPALCERLRAGVADADWAHIDPRLSVTVSIGYAFCDRDDDPAAVMILADRRMYEAKHGGRNRVVSEGGQAGRG